MTARLTAHYGCHLRACIQCRDVFLLCKPATHISDYCVKTPLTFSEDGELKEAKYGPSLSDLLDSEKDGPSRSRQGSSQPGRR